MYGNYRRIYGFMANDKSGLTTVKYFIQPIQRWNDNNEALPDKLTIDTAKETDIKLKY